MSRAGLAAILAALFGMPPCRCVLPLLPRGLSLPNLPPTGHTQITGGHLLNMRITRRLQHGPRHALQIRLQG